MEPVLFREAVNEEAGDQSHKDKSDQVTAGGTGQLGGTTGEAGKYRKTDNAKKQIDQITDGSVLHSEYIQGDVNSQIGKGDRNRCTGDLDG